jgi:hypothetical protein
MARSGTKGHDECPTQFRFTQTERNCTACQSLAFVRTLSCQLALEKIHIGGRELIEFSGGSTACGMTSSQIVLA